MAACGLHFIPVGTQRPAREMAHVVRKRCSSWVGTPGAHTRLDRSRAIAAALTGGLEAAP